MTFQISRRELIAWLAAGAGAAATGISVTRARGDGNPPAADSETPDDRADASDAPNSVANRRDTDQAPTGGGNTPGDRLLLVVEMPGGNDGLSSVVPYGNGVYYDARTQTAIPEGEVLDLDGKFGLHPNLAEMHKRGVLAVDGVGTTSPDGSHFEMAARWSAGNSQASMSPTGWIGRIADLLGADSSTASPLAALSVGSGAHPIIRSMSGSTVSMPSADALWYVSGADPEDVMRTAYQATLRTFATAQTPLGPAMNEGLTFADRMVELGLDDEDSEELGYDGGEFSNALRFAATVFAGEVGVRVVHVRTSGDYDTHEGHRYKHDELMRELDVGLAAFHRDLTKRGLEQRVLTMTTSEFGRTLKENSNGGLDHGAASTMLVSGPGLSGRVGEEISLTRVDENDNLRATTSVESYLGGVVEGWLGIPASEVFDAAHEPMALF